MDCKIHGSRCFIADSAGLAESIDQPGAAPIAPDSANGHDEVTAPNEQAVVVGWDRARGPDYGVEIIFVRIEGDQWRVLEVRHSPTSPAFGTTEPAGNTGTVNNATYNQKKQTTIINPHART